jgi:hypothetical protein
LNVAEAEVWWENVPKTMCFGKFEVRDLLELIFGEGRFTDVVKLQKWRPLIMQAVAGMRAVYLAQPVDYKPREYYDVCWARIVNARNDDERMLHALEDLRDMIKWE